MRLRQGTIASLVAELRGQCDDSAFVAVCVMARVSVWARSGCWRFFLDSVYTTHAHPPPCSSPHWYVVCHYSMVVMATSSTY